jgi:hypothetical protein
MANGRQNLAKRYGGQDAGTVKTNGAGINGRPLA